jgi:hypothetical protein
MSNYNVTRFLRSARHSLKGGSISFFKKTKSILENIIFFISFTKNFTTQKILMMENKHPSIYGQHKILYKNIKKNLVSNYFKSLYFSKIYSVYKRY